LKIAKIRIIKGPLSYWCDITWGPYTNHSQFYSKRYKRKRNAINAALNFCRLNKLDPRIIDK
jgi:hypothetical protein